MGWFLKKLRRLSSFIDSAVCKRKYLHCSRGWPGLESVQEYSEGEEDPAGQTPRLFLWSSLGEVRRQSSHVPTQSEKELKLHSYGCENRH